MEGSQPIDANLFFVRGVWQADVGFFAGGADGGGELRVGKRGIKKIGHQLDGVGETMTSGLFRTTLFVLSACLDRQGAALRSAWSHITINNSKKQAVRMSSQTRCSIQKRTYHLAFSTCQRYLDASVSAWCLKQLPAHDTLAVPCRVEAIRHWTADIKYQV